MTKENTRHHFNLALFESYLNDARKGTAVAAIAMIQIALLTFSTAGFTRTMVWLALVLSIDITKLLSIKFFDAQMDEDKFSRYIKWHFVLQVLLGLAWGSACFLLLPKGILSLNQTLVITVLSVAIAYSASIMSASKTGMLSFVTPFLLCLLLYFAMDISQFHWWFFGTIMLGASSVLFAHFNHQHSLQHIDSQLQNNRYIDELNKLKLSMQQANMELVVKNENLISAQNRLEMLATNDELTKVFNRRYAMTYLDKVFAELKRHHENFVVVLADIDHFKSINDRFGHPAGDEVLRRFSSVIKQQLREVDTVARFGGEEFLIMLPKTKELEAKAIIQRLCEMVAEQSFEFDQKTINVTASFGLAYYKVGDTVEKLIERADMALYHAKNSGRNNVKTFDEAAMAAYMAKK
ncbi:MAG TPA: GGDEF domain-containing protein [Methylotenera sp.]|nr:GGDEF domain-containing protein [Methylotenera sp.]HPH04810.1 GGDEF domain-containing protein [Methylotenera sp.]HPN02194.1 GGDEF domain-containing protein [Methylotenera sp.]